MAVSRSLLTPFRVGLVVILGIAAFFVMLSFISRQKYSDKQTYRVYATFRDASGLGPKSRVQIAGIEVGIVDRIDLTPAAHAKATLLIKNEVQLHVDSRITKRSASLLGDFLLDVYPGTPESPLLKDGDEIGKVVAQPGVEDVFAALGDVTRDIQSVTTSLKDLLASDEVGSIKEIIKSMNEVAQGLNHTISQAGGRLDNILADVETLSGNLRMVANGQSRNVEEILYNARTFTDQANRVLAGLDKIIGMSGGEVAKSVESVRHTLDQLDQTLKEGERTLASVHGAVDEVKGAITDVHGITASVEKGEGTLGKLVKDDGIAMKLDKTLMDVNTLLAPVTELQTHVNLRDEYHFPRNGGAAGSKAALTVRLQPRPDKFYGLEVLSDSRGKITRQRIVGNPAVPAIDAKAAEIETVTNDLKYSAYFGKRFGPATLRVGLLESTGGGGVDLHAWDDRLKFTVDAFDFANPDGMRPRVRTSLQATFLDHLYVGAGLDDLLNYDKVENFAPDSVGLGMLRHGTDVYVTGGLQFNDEDLKGLLTIVGMPAPK